MSIGTMLNGWRVYLPGPDGRPLVNGRVSFYNAGTSDDTELEAEVFADKELSRTLGTVVYADDTGMLPAIWLSRSHLYKAVVERLVSRFPTEVWESLYEIDDIGEVDASEPIVFTPARVCDTIGDMAKLPWSDLEGFVEVLGVNDPYDAGSTLVFKWNETSEEDNLGYAFVKPYGYQQAGRWEQVFNEGFIDVRKFGAFPGGSDVLSQIIHALRYASNVTYVRNPVTVSFASAGDYGIGGDIDLSAFKYNGAHVNVSICDGARFVNASTLGNVELKISPNTRIESGREIVGDYVDLVFDEDSVEYIRPQWFHSENGIFAEQLYKAATMDCNPHDIPVYVYGKVYAEGRNLPEFKATARIIWGDTSFVFSDAGSPQRGLFEASAGFECNSRIVFDLDQNSLWKCKFRDISEIDSRWVSSLQVVLDSSVEPSQVIRVHGTTVTGSVSNNSSRVLVDGVIKIANDATLTIGSVVNDLNHKIFDILPASQGHSRGRVFTLADKVSLDWFVGNTDFVSQSLEIDSNSFKDVLNAAPNNAELFFRTSAKINGTIELSGANRSFSGIDVNGGTLKLSFNYIDVIECRFNNVSISIESDSVNFMSNDMNNSTIYCKSNKNIKVTNNRFYGLNISDKVPVTIEAPRSCTGTISGNNFSDCQKIAQYIPVEVSGDLVHVISGITVTGNAVTDDSSQIYDHQELNYIVDFKKKTLEISKPGSMGSHFVAYFELTIPSLEFMRNRLFDKNGKFTVSLDGVKIGPVDTSDGGVHSFGISQFKKVASLSELEGKVFKIVYDTYGLDNYGIDDAEYYDLRNAGFFDEDGTTLYGIGKMYHSLSGQNRMSIWINVYRGNV